MPTKRTAWIDSDIQEKITTKTVTVQFDDGRPLVEMLWT